MLREICGIHDTLQFEIKHILPLEGGGRRCRSKVETYFFIPSSLCINPDTFTRKKFFKRLKSYVRLCIPLVPLHRFLDEDAPLCMLEKLLADRHLLTPKERKELFEDRVKILCLSFNRALEAWAGKVHHGRTDAPEQEVDDFIARTREVLQRYRAMQRQAEEAGLGDMPAYGYGDEYLSTITAYYGFRALDSLGTFGPAQHATNKESVGKEAAGKEIPPKKSDDKEPGNTGARKLLDYIQAEIDYRKHVLHTVVPRADGDNELFVHRWSMLKKYMSSALFLDVRKRRDTEFWQQAAYSVAAAVAMVFATGIAFIWQGRYGSLSMPLFGALVIAYIFKDRMKDYLKARMASGLRRFLSDRKRTIFRNFTTAIGVCKETFSFINESALPKEVAALRDKVHMVDISAAFRLETIICYRKDMELRSSAFKIVRNCFSDGLLDISRIGVHDFLMYMDEPEEQLYALKDGGGYIKASGNKVYHMNIIRRHILDKGTVCHRYRIVLDRNGIKRIEKLR